MFPTRDMFRKLSMSINSDCSFCFKTEGHIDHIFKECDLVTNVWYTDGNNCSNPFNTSTGINVDCLEYLWLNKSQYKKKIDDVLKKRTTILQAIGLIKTMQSLETINVICFVLELTKKAAFGSRDYSKCTNIFITPRVADLNDVDVGKRVIDQDQAAPQE